MDKIGSFIVYVSGLKVDESPGNNTVKVFGRMDKDIGRDNNDNSDYGGHNDVDVHGDVCNYLDIPIVKINSYFVFDGVFISIKVNGQKAI